MFSVIFQITTPKELYPVTKIMLGALSVCLALTLAGCRKYDSTNTEKDPDFNRFVSTEDYYYINLGESAVKLHVVYDSASGICYLASEPNQYFSGFSVM